MATKFYSLETVDLEYNKAKEWAQAERYHLEREWFRNCLFFLGIQWIVYNPKTNKWKPRDLKPWVPRPVTNKFASVANTIMQVLSSKAPDIRATPGTTSPEDIAAAMVADRNFDVILDEMEYDKARNIASAWQTLTGTVILHPCYDKDEEYGTNFLQSLQCQTCGYVFPPNELGEPVPLGAAAPPPMATDMASPTNGAGAGSSPLPIGAPPVLPSESQLSEGSCPKCKSPMVGEARDGNGEAIGEDIPKGRMKLEVYSGFEVFIDLEARSIKETDILTRRRYPLNYIQQRFNNYEIEADNESNNSGMLGINLLRAIAYASGNTMWATGYASGRAQGADSSVTVDTLWKRPCKDFPEGLVAIYANNKLLNDGKKAKDENFKDGLPYRDRDDKPIWNWHLINFDEVPGRIFGKTPMNDVAPKQEQRNKLESLIELTIKRTANPVWLTAKGTGITTLTGEPGQVIEGNWAMDPKLKPERVSGENVPTSVIAWLEKIDSDIEEIAGVFDVLRGNAPAGVTAGTALRLLLERANTRFTPVLQRSELGWQGVFQDAILIFQQYGNEKRINKIQGPGNTWEVQQFSNADLKGAIDIKVEAGSSVPKSTVGEQALIQDLIGTGIINPQDPNTQYKILEKFSSTALIGDTDLNIRYAQRENWSFINEKKMPVINPVLDLHPAHDMVHRQLALTSDFQALPDNMRNAFIAHILEHNMAMFAPMMNAPTPETEGKGSSPKANGGAEGRGNSGSTPREASAPPRQTEQEAGEPPLFPGV